MLAFLNIGPLEIVVLAVLGLLIFGKRLPEVGRSLGRGIVEFKKGLSGIEEELKNDPKQLDKSPDSTSTHSTTHAEKTRDSH